MIRAPKLAMLAVLFLVSTAASAATEIPDGTVLPVRLNKTLSSKNAKPGELIRARLMQDVPLPSFGRIKAGAMLFGKITSVEPASGDNGGSISFRFDTLKLGHETVRLEVYLRAVASYLEVDRAQLPLSGAEAGTPESTWTTVQIGGDVVHRGGGHVENRAGRVGEPVENGVLGRLDPNPGRGCRGDGTGERPQALWLFSSDACGTYGFANLAIAHAGKTDPVGEITLHSERGEVTVWGGSGMLLRVYAPEKPGA